MAGPEERHGEAEETVKEIHDLLLKLPERDWWGRQQIIADLVARPEHEYLAYIENGLRNHGDADIRNSAMEVFRALGVRAIPSLAALLREEDPEVRLFSVNILCDIRNAAALPLLSEAMRDPDVNVRCAAAEALGRTGDKRALSALEAAMTDETWVALAAVGALGEIGGEEALRTLHDCVDRGVYREAAVGAIEKAGGSGSVPHLMPCLSDPGLRGATLRAIVRIAEREGTRPLPASFISRTPLLVELLRSPDEEVKRCAFIALSWSDEIAGLPFLLDGVKENELQEYAIDGLLGLGSRAACGIVDELKQSQGEHRQILATVLSMIGETEALFQFINDGDPGVRTEVALALGQLDADRAVPALSRMLSDEHEEVRLAARSSLTSLAGNGYDPYPHS